MEFPRKRPSYEKERREKILKEIEQEYSLKRSIRGPKSPSPNLFMSKLRIRMSAYYNNLCNSKNLLTK